MRKKLDIGCEFLWKKTRQIARQKCAHVTSTVTYTSVTRTLPKWCSNRAKNNQSRQRILLKFWWESFNFTACVAIRHLLVLGKFRLVLSLDSGHPTQLFKFEAGSRSTVGFGLFKTQFVNSIFHERLLMAKGRRCREGKITSPDNFPSLAFYLVINQLTRSKAG